VSRKSNTVPLTSDELERVFDVIKNRRHPEKNTALIRLSFTLGLTPKELANLRVLDIFYPWDASEDLRIRNELRVVPQRYRSNKYDRSAAAIRQNVRSLRFSLAEFERVLKDVEIRVLNDEPIVPEHYYPIKNKYFKRTRAVPLSDDFLISALNKYMSVLMKHESFDQNSYFFISQKGGAYSANTLQEHIAVILRQWSAVPCATGLSGRKTLVTNMIKEGIQLRDIAHFIGYSSASSSFVRELGIEISSQAEDTADEETLLQASRPDI